MKTKAIVVGAGIIGLATAERLLKNGIEVTLLECALTGRESSWAGGGILSPLFPWRYPDEVTYLTSYSAEQFFKWTSDLHDKSGIDPEYERSGMLLLEPYEEEIAQQWCLSRNIKIQRKEICNSPQTLKHALYFPDIAQVRNPKLLSALSTRITQLGGRIIENCSVTRFNIGYHKVQSIISTCGEFSSDYYVVSAGAWSAKILEKHALNLEIKPIKGQMLLFKYDSPPISNIIVQNDIYLIPRRDGHLLVGSTLEDVGFDKETTLSAQNYLLTQAQIVLPSLNKKKVIKHWSGLRPASPNNIPTIGRHPLIRNLFINSGHFRYGVTMAPASAEILVNEIIGTPQPFDISPYQMK